MTQALAAPQKAEELEPLNPRQMAFARYLGIAIAKGGRDAELVEAYRSAGYKPDRGNARRLAADPRIRAIADEACAEELRIAGLRIGYLQGLALKVLHLSPVTVFRAIQKCCDTDGKLRPDLSAAEIEELESATWAMHKFAGVEIPKKGEIIEMLAKQLGVGRDDNSVNVGVSLEALIGASYQAPQKTEAA